MIVSVAGRSTVVGTTLRAIASLYSLAAKGFRLREVGVFNTTTTAVAVALVRFTATGTQGAALTEVAWDATVEGTPQITGFAGHTADGTVGSAIRQAVLGAAAGAGVIWTFGSGGLVIPVGVANGIGVICPTGTGQILDYYFDWEE
jgi:hypothetical protein